MLGKSPAWQDADGACSGTIASAGDHPYLLDEAFAISEYDTTQTVEIGSLSVRFQPVPHDLPCNAIQVRCEAGGRFAFGADQGRRMRSTASPTTASRSLAKARSTRSELALILRGRAAARG